MERKAQERRKEMEKLITKLDYMVREKNDGGNPVTRQDVAIDILSDKSNLPILRATALFVRTEELIKQNKEKQI